MEALLTEVSTLKTLRSKQLQSKASIAALKDESKTSLAKKEKMLHSLEIKCEALQNKTSAVSSVLSTGMAFAQPPQFLVQCKLFVFDCVLLFELAKALPFLPPHCTGGFRRQDSVRLHGGDNGGRALVS